MSLAWIGIGCSSTPEGDGGPDCPEGQTYSETLAKCVDKVGGRDIGDKDTGTSETGGEEDIYGGGACEKRSNYLVVHEPNVFFVFDRSESMQGMPMQQAKSGLDQVADAIAGDVRVGMSMFPLSGQCSSKRLLEMGQHSASEIKNAYAGLDGVGGTPAGKALEFVRTEKWYDKPGDAKSDKRGKAVILITDGKPNDQEICEDPHTAWNEAERLRRADVPVYVIGFKTGNNLEPLDKIAEKGGTDAPGDDKFYTTSDGSELATTLKAITQSSVACGVELDPPVPEGASVNVTLAGEQVPKGKNDGYVYEDATAMVKLTGSWCEKLQTQSKEEGTTLEIDVGCPDCAVAGESCSGDGDCCDGSCEDGTCVEACRSSGETCRSDEECCSGTCASGQGEKLGQCVQT
ncbi:MAG: VWA domain-containing protein [Bradymonadaceae bacterium]